MLSLYALALLFSQLDFSLPREAFFEGIALSHTIEELENCPAGHLVGVICDSGIQSRQFWVGVDTPDNSLRLYRVRYPSVSWYINYQNNLIEQLAETYPERFFQLPLTQNYLQLYDQDTKKYFYPSK